MMKSSALVPGSGSAIVRGSGAADGRLGDRLYLLEQTHRGFLHEARAPREVARGPQLGRNDAAIPLPRCTILHGRIRTSGMVVSLALSGWYRRYLMYQVQDGDHCRLL